MSDGFASLISGIIGAALGALGVIITLRFNYQKLFAKTVSQNRMDWINNFREELAIVIAATRRPCTDEMLFQAEKARAKLLTRLNQNTSKSGNEYNSVMAQRLEQVTFKSKRGFSPPDESVSKELIELSRKILEPEWQRVKREARGQKHG